MKVEVVALHRSGHLKNKFEMSAGDGLRMQRGVRSRPAVLILLLSSFGLLREVASPLHGRALLVALSVEQVAATRSELPLQHSQREVGNAASR